MHSEGGSNTAEYYSQRNLHPRTGDYAAFSGRGSQQSISPRSDFHEDAWASHSSINDSWSHDSVPANADVELEGVTPDGGMALNVQFPEDDDQQEEAALDAGPGHNQSAQKQAQGEQVITCGTHCFASRATQILPEIACASHLSSC